MASGFKSPLPFLGLSTTPSIASSGFLSPLWLTGLSSEPVAIVQAGLLSPLWVLGLSGGTGEAPAPTGPPESPLFLCDIGKFVNR